MDFQRKGSKSKLPHIDFCEIKKNDLIYYWVAKLHYSVLALFPLIM